MLHTLLDYAYFAIVCFIGICCLFGAADSERTLHARTWSMAAFLLCILLLGGALASLIAEAGTIDAR